MPSSEHMRVEILLQDDEWLEWNRAALKARSDLPAWIRLVVNGRPTRSPRQRRTKAAIVGEPELLYREDELAHEKRCRYCGAFFDFTATRRKVYCSDRCRVRAWRVLKRREARN